MSSKPFFVDYDKRGAAKCKRCKQKLEKGMLRIAKVGTNPFSEEGGEMKFWHHVDCLFESFKKARATTKKVDDPYDDIEGLEDISKEDKKIILEKVKEYHEENEKGGPKKNTTPKKTPSKPQNSKKGSPKSNNSPKEVSKPAKASSKSSENGAENLDISSSKSDSSTTSKSQGKLHKDEMFKEFRKLCANIAEESSYLEKTKIVSEFFDKGSDGGGFKGDLRLWVRLLLPGVVKRVYNLQSRQLIKLFSQLFRANQEEMLEDLEKGDIAETIRVYFEMSTSLTPAKKSNLSLKEVDDLLEELEGQTTEENQSYILKKAAKRSTGNDLKMIVRLIKGDLRINAGAKHILEGLHSDAYEAFQTTRNIDAVLDDILSQKGLANKDASLEIKARIMTPVLPMLAQACKSVDQAFKKCPNGMYAEIKYDGERVQLHKKGSEFRYFSRSLKPVMEHKVSHFKEHIPLAFPHGSNLILDSEILLIDTKTNLPLPFGSLGKHKKDEFKDANVCLFVFDCIHFNGVNLMNESIVKRRQILEKNMVEIKHHVVLSEMKEVHKPEELQKMIQSVIKQGLEGLVLKDLKSIYEPGKRHWLKVKKDYLQDGAMADSADLVVLGAWYGTGKKGGMMSIFLMGCYDPNAKIWCTVTKVHTGHDDAALERLQTELKMEKISQNPDMLPAWIKCSRSLTPDFVAKDPKKSPVWEISGAEFTKNQVHTADGISIRFPRVTKERPDKDWSQATNLTELKDLYEKSKEHTDFKGLQSDHEDNGSDDQDDEGETKGNKRSKSSSPQSKKRHNNRSDSSSPSKLKGKVNDSPQARNKKKPYSHEKTKNDSSSASLQETKPSKLDIKSESKTYKPPISNLLLDVFEGVRLHLPKDTEDFSTLRRYFIAYGGELIDQYDKGATHFISTDNENSLEGERVSVDWLWDSIKLKELQPCKLYQK